MGGEPLKNCEDFDRKSRLAIIHFSEIQYFSQWQNTYKKTSALESLCITSKIVEFIHIHALSDSFIFGSETDSLHRMGRQIVA